MATGPLAGVRILDLTRVWAGPLATRILGDLGADLLKIEAPTGRGQANVAPGQRSGQIGGDQTRPWNQQASFNKLNRNKRSLCIDLKSDVGKTVFLDLVRGADVVIENFSAKAMSRLGLGPDRLREVNPRLIYVAMPGYGLFGPYTDYVAYGPSIEPMTGLTSIMGYGPSEPRVTSVALPDASAGTWGAAAVLAAMERRDRTGRGCLVDLSQHEGAMNLLGEYYVEAQRSGEAPAPIGNAHAVFAPHGVFPCQGDDDWIALAARTEEEWLSFAAVAGRGWALDARFADMQSRREHRAALDDLISDWTLGYQKQELMELLQSVGVPAGAVLSAPDLLSDPHLAARQFFIEFDQPDVGRIPYPGTPVKVQGRRGDGWTPAPTLGQHNRDVLEDILQMTDSDIEELYRAGVIADHPPG
jgi:crotonobetainyl-CoA:carnitine CoA-transferase CaiB-like acyl-CoA transferase